jgi:hypothetical protein
LCPWWPWRWEWWKPGNRVRELEKAGALIAAEIDRLSRIENKGDIKALESKSKALQKLPASSDHYLYPLEAYYGYARNEITIVFRLSKSEYEKAAHYIENEKYRHYWAKNAFMEKVARMEANDKKARDQRMITDAAYINELIQKGLINTGKET